MSVTQLNIMGEAIAAELPGPPEAKQKMIADINARLGASETLNTILDEKNQKIIAKYPNIINTSTEFQEKAKLFESKINATKDKLNALINNIHESHAMLEKASPKSIVLNNEVSLTSPSSNQ